jgi:NAD(P)-dependent dehydrogenase (short-subunit alcohol dehydrogenase family)
MLIGKTVVVIGISSGIGARAHVIGVDVNAPASPLGAFVRADISSAAAIAELARALPSRFDALCNVAGVSGVSGAAKTLEINFYGLRALSEALAPQLHEGGAVVNVASIAGYGWRANLKRANAFVDPLGFPNIAALLERFEVPDGEGYPLSKESCYCGRCAPPANRCFASAACASTRSAQGRRRRRSLRSSARSSAIRASTTTSPRSAASASPPTSLPPRCSSVRTARAGSTAPICRSTADSRLRSTPASSASKARGVKISSARQARLV